jgi:Phage portal protein
MQVQRLLNAGKELIKGDFDTALKSLSSESYDLIPSTYRPSIGGLDNFVFEANGSSTFHFRYFGHNSSVRAYEYCPPVNAIINRKAQAYINGKTWVLNTSGKAKGKEATSVEAKKLQALFKKPNPLQSWKQFEAQGYIYQQLFGFTIVLPIKPIGFKDNIDATALWNIPPSMVDIEETNKLFYQTDTKGIIKQIVLKYKGARTILNVEDIYIMKDFTPSFCSLVIPDSRIHALELPINNIIGAYESRNVLINYRGALGILSQDPGNGQFGSLPMTDGQKELLQNELRRYGLKEQQWQFIITSAALKWQQMGVATKDLMLFEEIEADTMAICDSYTYPYQLMSSASGTTFSNLNEGKKLLYQDATMPEAESMYEQWNQFFNTDAYGLIIDKDYSHVAVLQEDKLQSAQARKALDDALTIEFQNGLITLDDWLEKLGEDPLPNGLGQVRATDPKSSNVPLAVTIGVGGVQGLIAVITAQGMSEEAKQATLEIVFGLSSQDAIRMSVQSETQTNTNETGNQQGQDQGQAAA